MLQWSNSCTQVSRQAQIGTNTPILTSKQNILHRLYPSNNILHNCWWHICTFSHLWSDWSSGLSEAPSAWFLTAWWKAKPQDYLVQNRSSFVMRFCPKHQTNKKWCQFNQVFVPSSLISKAFSQTIFLVSCFYSISPRRLWNVWQDL